MTIAIKDLISRGASPTSASHIADRINSMIETLAPENAWRIISKEVLQPSDPFALHHFIFSTIYRLWPKELDSAPAYLPETANIEQSNLYQTMSSLDLKDLKTFHQWTVTQHETFLAMMLQRLGIRFDHPPNQILKVNQGTEQPNWLCGSKINIVNSCFNADPNKTAIIYSTHDGNLHQLSYGELNRLTDQVALSLKTKHFLPGDRIAILMPMTAESIAIYLGIIKIGGVVVSIPESFSAEEIRTRLTITEPKAIFTQDIIVRDQKKISLYDKISQINPPPCIVLSYEKNSYLPVRHDDIAWNQFLVDHRDIISHTCNPMDPINILFSSGTTGTPKAIPWNHTTAIKCASDAYFHQDIHPNDILTWPSSLGWMMGPWLIFATFLNKATLALYHDLPKSESYGKFIQDAKVTMLGVVPTIVNHWRQKDFMRKFDWTSIKKFTTTAECSNAEDMLYLMSLAQYAPVIEYCGGTEIGGGYLSSTVIEKNYPSVFTTPVMGIDFIILDEKGHSTNNGEVAIIPPALGLSTELLNANHHVTYYQDMPKTKDGRTLRRHGDQIFRTEKGNYFVLGRMDDTMNLSGIKVSSAEIERTIAGIEGINESAAIGVNLGSQGPSSLIIYAATTKQLCKDTVKTLMQEKINSYLNPLFKIYDIVFVDELPKTASNKIMRKTLRNEYKKNKPSTH